MKTVLEKNNLGSWYGWEIEHKGTSGERRDNQSSF